MEKHPDGQKNILKLNDELLKKEKAPDDKPKRNSKEFLIDKILQVADENNLEINVSNTRLKRMSKEKLQQMLGEMCEDAVKSQMAAAVNAPGKNDDVIALATLRMVHDLFANGLEQGLNAFLPKYGYEVDGFAQTLQDPLTSKCVDACLTEIAAENDVLQYIQSPWTRLMIAWSGGMMRALRKAPRNIGINRKYASTVGPKPPHPQNPLRPRASGGPATGKINGRSGPPQPNVRSV
jgi:hypothetical protein